MNRFGYILITMLFMATTTMLNAQKRKDQLTMVVGSYTDKGAEGLGCYRFNQESGEFSLISSAKSLNPSFLAFSPCGKYLYAVNETKAEMAAISSFKFSKKKGAIEAINSVKVLGAAPCYLNLLEEVAISANYNGGSISVVGIDKSSGALTKLLSYQEFANREDGIRSHLHAAVTTPDGKHIIATDLGRDKLYTFKSEDILALDGESNTQTPYSTISVKKGSGPRHLTINRAGSRLYLLNELSGTVITYALEDGSLKELSTVVADSLGASGSADIHLSGDERFLYATNRLKGDGISTFSISPKDGIPTKIGYNNTGSHPRNFIITPNDKYILIACKNSNVIEIFRRDCESGLLTKEGTIEVDSPVCIKFAD